MLFGFGTFATRIIRLALLFESLKGFSHIDSFILLLVGFVVEPIVYCALAILTISIASIGPTIQFRGSTPSPASLVPATFSVVMS